MKISAVILAVVSLALASPIAEPVPVEGDVESRASYSSYGTYKGAGAGGSYSSYGTYKGAGTGGSYSSYGDYKNAGKGGSYSNYGTYKKDVEAEE